MRGGRPWNSEMLVAGMQPRKELADMDQGCAYVVAGNGQRAGRDDHRHAAAGAHGESFAEDRHAEEDGRDGFQGSEDRRGRGSHVLDGRGGAEERYGRGEDGERRNGDQQSYGCEERDVLAPHFETAATAPMM